MNSEQYRDIKIHLNFYCPNIILISKIRANDSTIPIFAKVGIPKKQFSFIRTAAPPELPCSTLADVI